MRKEQRIKKMNKRKLNDADEIIRTEEVRDVGWKAVIESLMENFSLTNLRMASVHSWSMQQIGIS